MHEKHYQSVTVLLSWTHTLLEHAPLKSAWETLYSLGGWQETLVKVEHPSELDQCSNILTLTG